MLLINDLNVFYGKAHILYDINIKVDEGKIIAILGSNGSGKSTLLRTISGLTKPSAGKITFYGDRIDGISSNEIVKKGISHCPEGRRIFSKQTVLENLKMGGYICSDKNELQDRIDNVFQIFPKLKERYKQLGGTLSGGEQQMLAVGRAMMSKPKLLILDEPSAGLAPIIAEEIENVISQLRNDGITILWVEQNVMAALNLCDYVYLLENGNITIEGLPKDLLNNDDIRKAYLS